MKTNYLILLFLIISCYSYCLTESDDTTEIYVVNNTNRFVTIQNESSTIHSFFYRDLKFMKETRELIFMNEEDVIKFFDLCDKALATDKTIITKEYNLSRNKLNKHVVRLNNKSGGYTLIKEDTLEAFRKAFEKSLE